MRVNEALSNTLVVKKIIKRIEKALIEGELKPGDKVPAEREFVQKFKVSRTSFREAIKMLTALGVVKIKRGDGTYVTKGNSNSIIDPLVFSLILEEKIPQHLLQLRKILEVGILMLVIDEVNEEDISKMEKAIESLEENYRKKNSNATELTHCDLSFHLAFAEATHNPLIVRIMGVVLNLVFSSIRRTHLLFKDTKQAIKEHKALLAAITQRDIIKAQEAVSLTLESWRKYGLENESSNNGST